MEAALLSALAQLNTRGEPACPSQSAQGATVDVRTSIRACVLAMDRAGPQRGFGHRATANQGVRNTGHQVVTRSDVQRWRRSPWWHPQCPHRRTDTTGTAGRSARPRADDVRADHAGLERQRRSPSSGSRDHTEHSERDEQASATERKSEQCHDDHVRVPTHRPRLSHNGSDMTVARSPVSRG